MINWTKSDDNRNKYVQDCRFKIAICKKLILNGTRLIETILNIEI